jgi:hypothetical protein
MTRDDITHLSEVARATRPQMVDEQYNLFLDRLLWAIHASEDNPQFDENRFREACRGEGGFDIWSEPEKLFEAEAESSEETYTEPAEEDEADEPKSKPRAQATQHRTSKRKK